MGVVLGRPEFSETPLLSSVFGDIDKPLLETLATSIVSDIDSDLTTSQASMLSHMAPSFFDEVMTAAGGSKQHVLNKIKDQRPSLPLDAQARLSVMMVGHDNGAAFNALPSDPILTSHLMDMVAAGTLTSSFIQHQLDSLDDDQKEMLIPVHTFAKLVEGSQDPGDSFDTLKARDLAMMLDRLPDRQLASFYAHPNVATHLETLFSEVPTEEELRYFSARSRVEEDERYASGQMKSYLTTPFARDMKGVRTRTTWEGSRSIYEKYKDDPVKNQKFDTMQLRQVVRRQIMDTPEFGATVLSGLVGSIPAEGDPEDLRLPTESRVQPLKLFHALPTATQLKVMDAMGDDELNSFYENIKQTPESLGHFYPCVCKKIWSL